MEDRGWFARLNSAAAAFLRPVSHNVTSPGHQVVLSRALAHARERIQPALVLTFEPHPRTFFRPNEPIFRITPAPLKALLLKMLGFEGVVEVPFDRRLSQLSADEFVSEILIASLGASAIVTGFDFHFGRGREGGPASLLEAGKRYDFEVKLIDAFRNEYTEVISSSRIRTLLRNGDTTEAARHLGYRYTVEANFELGGQNGGRGALAQLSSELGLLFGLYAVRIRLEDGTLHNAVAGYDRWALDGSAQLQIYTNDSDVELGGRQCSISFFSILKPETNSDPREEAVGEAIDKAKVLLANVQPLSDLDAAVCFAHSPPVVS